MTTDTQLGAVAAPECPDDLNDATHADIEDAAFTWSPDIEDRTQSGQGRQAAACIVLRLVQLGHDVRPTGPARHLPAAGEWHPRRQADGARGCP
ncbi:hypothetical protein [Streptomyces sp. NPDC053069]|uniref:hypothetical protein n=1 Tax=Streptomyces sp. NPDC053069 TaxID=3365695 RepID=UPI0037D38F17